jgi:hypothetical protein
VRKIRVGKIDIDPTPSLLLWCLFVIMIELVLGKDAGRIALYAMGTYYALLGSAVFFYLAILQLNHGKDKK